MKLANESELFEAMEAKLGAALVSDVVDSLGARNQAMKADVVPMYLGARVVGRAYTVLAADVFQAGDDPYRGEIEAVDSLKTNDVVVLSTNGSTRTCVWGELLSTAAQCRGARGAVIDGYSRDVSQIASMGFPTFATGRRPVDSAGRSIVIDHGCPIECGGVIVRTGDIVFGDIDGVIVIPKELEKQVICRALEKAGREDLLRKELLAGATLSAAYAKYQVL